MNDTRMRSWMRELASSAPEIPMPPAERIEALALLQREFTERRRAAAPLAWCETALAIASGLGFAAFAVWLEGLSR